MAAAGTEDAAKYAESLRKNLMDDLFEGDELQDGNERDAEWGIDDLVGGSNELTLLDIDKDLDEFQEHEVIKGILEQGRVLKEYARDIDDKLRQAEMESIQEYIQESDTMVALHEQIKNCDGILNYMEQLLGKFQGDLGKVSEEIRQLQVQSQMMSTKLKNRRAMEGKMGSFIDHVTISEVMVQGILESEVNEDYLEFLMELDKKLKFIGQDDIARTSQAKHDLQPALEKLRIKAISKVSYFMMQKLYMLKRPKTNVQIIQQNSLLKYKYFVRFLRLHGPDVYAELRNEYIGILSRIYSSHFRTYLGSMEKMQAVVAQQSDVLGIAENPGGGGSMLGGLFSKNTARATTEAVFELGDRVHILDEADKPAIIPHMAEAEGRRFPYEVIFRNVHKLLMDSATSEYFFCLDFFEEESVFKDLFTPIVAVVEGDLANSLQSNFDALSVLLMIRINHAHRKVMTQRHVPYLDDYLDRINLMLWPRLKMLFDMQLASVRTGLERQLFTDSVAVHTVAKRYAALASSMLLLMAEYDSDETGLFKAQTFYDMMDRLWAAICDMLLRMSNFFKERRSGIIFLIVNYNHIMATLRTADNLSSSGGGAGPGAGEGGGAACAAAATGIGRTGATAIKDCEDQLANCTSLYVEDQLSNHFPILVEFVKKAEQQQKRLAVPEGQLIPNFAPAQAGPIMKDFGARWKAVIEDMHKEVAKHFTHASCGKDVLQASLTSLLKYYTRLLELMKKQGPEGQAVIRDAVNIPSIMYEIKNITKT